jgi:hypothetical protein
MKILAENSNMAAKENESERKIMAKADSETGSEMAQRKQ